MERQITQVGLPNLSPLPSGWLRHTDEFGLPGGLGVVDELVVLSEHRVGFNQNGWCGIAAVRTRLGSSRLLTPDIAKLLIVETLLSFVTLILSQGTIADDDAVLAVVLTVDAHRALVQGSPEHPENFALRAAPFLLPCEQIRCGLKVLSSDGQTVAVEELLDALLCISCHGDTFPTLCIFPFAKPANGNVRGTIPLTTLSDEIYAC